MANGATDGEQPLVSRDHDDEASRASLSGSMPAVQSYRL